MYLRHANPRACIIRVLSVALLALSVFLNGALVDAQTLPCGAVIGPNAEVTLQTDIGPCDDNVATVLTIVGPVTVDLTDSVVVCRDSDRDGIRPVGIVLTGEGVKLRRGGVDSCRVGVRIQGTGKHHIHDVLVGESQTDGFSVESNGNTLQTNIARNSKVAGFRDTRTGTTLTGNLAVGNFLGFVLDGIGQTVIRNRATTQWGNGFVFTSDNSTFTDNQAKDNGGKGFRIAGRSNTLQRNKAENNTDDGFNTSGADSTFSFNTAVKNRGDGFVIGGSTQTFTSNTARENHGYGFRVLGKGISLTSNIADLHGLSGLSLGLVTTEAIIRENTVTRSKGFDLEDQSVNCGTNRWSKNIFGTRNQPCIQ